LLGVLARPPAIFAHSRNCSAGYFSARALPPFRAISVITSLTISSVTFFAMLAIIKLASHVFKCYSMRTNEHTKATSEYHHSRAVHREGMRPSYARLAARRISSESLWPSYGTESRSTIKKLKTLHERLNTIAAEIEQVQAKPLKFLCGHSLTRYWVRSGFLVDTTLIRSEAKKLKEAANSLSRLTTKRKDVRREAINHLYVCCCCVPGERKKARAITYSDVADLLDEYETKKGIANKDKPVVENAVGKAVTRVIARRN